MLSKANGRGSSAAQWVAVNTRPHNERVAMVNFERQKFIAYCPMIRKQIRHARRTRDELRPLFPSYVFVAISHDFHGWRPLLSTSGVRGVVRCGDRLSFLAPEFIEGLKSRECDGAIVRPTRPYEIGQQVRLTGGATDGLIATIMEMREKDRIVVLLNLLNRPVRIKLSANQVTAA